MSDGGQDDSVSLRLVPVTDAHVPLLLRWRRDPVTRRFNPLRAMDEPGMRARVAAESKPLEEGRTCARFMALREDIVVGTVALKEVNWVHRMAELGMGIAPEHRGRGYAAVVVRLGLAVAFETVGLERVWATAHCDNLASHRALHRAGFRREGVLRKHYVIDGRRIDHVVFGVLAEQWRRGE